MASQVEQGDPALARPPAGRREGPAGGSTAHGSGSPRNHTMRMSNFVVREAIIVDLAGESREAVITEMVAGLEQAGYFQPTERDDIVRAILRREQLGSTGIGRQIAIPHSKHAGVDRLIGTIGISKKGVPFDSIDGEAACIFVLLISPQDRPGDHLRALENVVRTLKDDALVERLRSAETVEDVWALIDESQPPWSREGGSPE